MITRLQMLLVALVLFPATGSAQQEIPDIGWPREKTAGPYTLTLYQPQIDEWAEYQNIRFRMAVAVEGGSFNEPRYGVLEIAAETWINRDERSVLFTDVASTVRFAGIEGAEGQQLEQAVRSVLPDGNTFTVSLDRMLAQLDRSAAMDREIEVSYDPPPIYYSDRPAALLMFLGQPSLKPVPGTNLLFAVNTNWDLFFDTTSSNYYLLFENGWLQSRSLDGGWQPAQAPADLAKLPDDENWSDVKKNIPGQPLASVPNLVVSYEPAEMIVTEGQPAMTPIPGTQLFYITNTDSDLFYNGGDRNYYYLIAGRWFRSNGLQGPWSAATTDLPETFAAIPEGHEKVEVLASVAGTPEAEEAAIQASIPQKATVTREGTTVAVQYEGDPRFETIQGSQGVSYAVNTPHTVLMADGRYYCCESGVWFVAAGPVGPWRVADQIPAAIYTIPASSPLHNVTYVYVYDSNPTEVTVGYTSGYEGAYVVGGLLMFGAGLTLGAILDDNDYWYRWHCWPSYYSYGCHAHYSYYRGGFVRAGRYYGPYGGAGFGARYNPWTGRYARGAYAYGPYRSAGFGRAYNPITGTTARGGYYSGPWGTAARGAVYNPRTDRGIATRQVRTPYGSWGRTVVSHGDRWAQFGHRSGPLGGTTIGARGSEGRGGVIRKTPGGDWRVVGRDKSGDVYAGYGGQVYRRNDNQWQQHSNSNRSWKSTGTAVRTYDKRTRPTTGGVRVDPLRPTKVQPKQPVRTGTGQRVVTPRPTTPTSRTLPKTGSRSSVERLQRDSWSRSRGSKLQSRAKTSRSRGAIRRRR